MKVLYPKRLTAGTRLFLSLLLLLPYTHTDGQSGLGRGSIQGVVMDADRTVISFASILLLDTQKGTTSDEEGAFALHNVAPGLYQVQISYVGYATAVVPVRVTNDSITTMQVMLDDIANDLDEIVVSAKSEATRTAETGFNVAVLESKSYRNLNVDINEVLRSTPGINLRERGGLGSGFNLSLNGLSGNQIRYFIDGVPMENYGSSLSLNNFPINLVDHIEVYKGVVPVHLGADALGGAINIIPSDNYQSYLDVSYSQGSFNTHRFSLNARLNNAKRGFFLQTYAFLNHSDNSYRMDSVKVWDLELGNFLGYQTVSRFHNDYTSGMAKVQGGVIDKKWADRFTFSLSGARNRKEFQHPDNKIKRVFGQFHTRNSTYLASANYTKTLGRLKLTANASTGMIRESVIDTSQFKYNWTGDFIRRSADDPKGELYERRSLFNLKDVILRSNLSGSYNISGQHQIQVNLVQSHLRRSGNDEVDAFNQSFTTPNLIDKYILAGGYTFHTATEELEVSAFTKSYWFSGAITTQNTEGNEQRTEPSFDNIGYGLTSRWSINNNLTAKASFERAYRLPEPYEILGDGIYVNVNPALRPEKSYNLNFGLNAPFIWDDWHFTGEINYFLRSSADFIRFLPLGPFGEYENLTNVRTEGVEASVEGAFSDLFLFSGNITYQNITDQNKWDEGLPNINYQSRIPNIPYLFANARLGIQPITRERNRLGIFWSSKFVEAFFLNWENLGSPDSKNIIPAQLTHNLDIEYAFGSGKYNLALSVRNLTDAVVYDNFNIQLPGRAFYTKLRYFISK
jgi:outer membrane cobalamin receptor